MTNELYFLSSLIASILNGEPSPQVPHELDWQKVFNMVVMNGFSVLVYERMKDIQGIPAQLLSSIDIKYKAGIRRSVLQEHYTNRILEQFEREGIRCLPLKGIILRKLYPKSFMRSMSDLDILVDADKLRETRRIMGELGFEVYRYDTHHDIYYTKSGVNVELHKMLIVGEMENYFQIGFERAYLKEDCKYTYEMSKEDFYIHMLGHMAYHFAYGGVGIRAVLDIQVYRKHYKNVLDHDYLKKELDKLGLFVFATHMEKLAAIWFTNEESNEFYDELGDYIVKSGYLGSQKHREVLEVVRQSSTNVNKWIRIKAIITAIFLPYKSLAFSYPILNKYPALLPVMWVARWIKILRERKENVSRLRRLYWVEDVEIRRLGELYDKLGMRHLI